MDKVNVLNIMEERDYHEKKQELKIQRKEIYGRIMRWKYCRAIKDNLNI